MISIIIQGPVHEHSLNNLENYRRFGQVIISCYHDCIVPKLPKDVKVVKSEVPFNYCQSNLHKQAWTTLQGLYLADYTRCIKVRSDEYYTDLSYFIEVVRKNPFKWVTNNVHFMPFDKSKWHPSDHVIATDKKDFIGACKTVLNVLQTRSWENNVFNTLFHTLTPECQFYLSYIDFLTRENWDTMDFVYEVSRGKELMLETCEVVPVDKMGDFCWTQNGVPNRIFEKDTQRLKNNGCIWSMDEL